MNYADYNKGKEKEWLITNGLGGYASSTLIGANTRKYHGLLIASMSPPVKRRVLLSSLDEELIVEGNEHSLSVHKYPDVIHPHGNEYIESTTIEPFPVFRYRAGSMMIKKSIMMPYGENTTIVRYDINNPEEKKGIFRIFPLVNNRSIHHMTSSSELNFSQQKFSGGIVLEEKDLSFCLCSDIPYKADEHWYYNFEYEIELSRGYPYREDNFNPGYFELKIEDYKVVCFIVASTETEGSRDIEKVQKQFDKEKKRKANIIRGKWKKDTFYRKLALAGDSFIVHRRSSESRSIIAGYHWFGDWGRDTMISLPGMTLVTGRFNEARSILSTFAAHCKKGLIPNLFPEDAVSSPSYNTVDASLWFIHAAGRYYEYTDDLEFIERIWHVIENILAHYRNGTFYRIKMDDDGLIEHGGQLTWMDAKAGEIEFTPRKGKACEINALWYNALIYATKMGKELDRDISGYHELAELTKKSFRTKFWNHEKECLFDCLSGSGHENERDASVRPNQIFAVSLPNTMLSPDSEKCIVDIVTEELLTPYGLRTLSPHDPAYIGTYGGDTETRDAAYHNGTVWPWLMGPYVTAYSKVYRNTPGIKRKLSDLLKGIEKHMDEACIGTISEVFDGDMPHEAGGCVSQAWSVAEVLRCYYENIMNEK